MSDGLQAVQCGDAQPLPRAAAGRGPQPGGKCRIVGIRTQATREAVRRTQRRGRAEPGQRARAAVQRLAHERFSVHGEVERLPRPAVVQGEIVGVAVEDAGDRVQPVGADQVGVLSMSGCPSVRMNGPVPHGPGASITHQWPSPLPLRS